MSSTQVISTVQESPPPPGGRTGLSDACEEHPGQRRSLPSWTAVFAALLLAGCGRGASEGAIASSAGGGGSGAAVVQVGPAASAGPSGAAAGLKLDLGACRRANETLYTQCGPTTLQGTARGLRNVLGDEAPCEVTVQNGRVTIRAGKVAADAALDRINDEASVMRKGAEIMLKVDDADKPTLILMFNADSSLKEAGAAGGLLACEPSGR